MPIMKLSDLTSNIKVVSTRGGLDPELSGLAYDSRAVEPGFLFFALPGIHQDGHGYIVDAIRRGARAIVHSEDLGDYAPGVAYLRVENPRTAMSPLSDAFFGHPSRELGMIGVTGTDGKSTSVSYIYQLLEMLARPSGFVSTVQFKAKGDIVPNPYRQSTPEPTEIHNFLREMVSSGKEFAVIESTSHGLSEKTNRLGDIAFDAAMMTNVTHEHLEFHGCLERYREDKANLFRLLDRHSHEKTILGARRFLPSFGVVNADDPSSEAFIKATAKPVYSYSPLGAEADLAAEAIRLDAGGSSFIVREREGTRYEARLEVPGNFNVYNALGVVLLVSRLLGIPVAEIIPLLTRLEPVKGRMTWVDSGQGFAVIVDYAHTPAAFLTILPAMKKSTKGRLIAVFGSGGERDTGKRPLQGRVAADYCDILILADEDPRGEDPQALLSMIAEGCPERRQGEDLFIIPDRPTALRKALSLAREGDTVMLLGKGHESSIIKNDGAMKYDEIEEAKKALAEMGYAR